MAAIRRQSGSPHGDGDARETFHANPKHLAGDPIDPENGHEALSSQGHERHLRRVGDGTDRPELLIVRSVRRAI